MLSVRDWRMASIVGSVLIDGMVVSSRLRGLDPSVIVLSASKGGCHWVALLLRRDGSSEVWLVVKC